jgi:hypothetical protein
MLAIVLCVSTIVLTVPGDAAPQVINTLKWPRQRISLILLHRQTICWCQFANKCGLCALHASLLHVLFMLEICNSVSLTSHYGTMSDVCNKFPSSILCAIHRHTYIHKWSSWHSSCWPWTFLRFIRGVKLTVFLKTGWCDSSFFCLLDGQLKIIKKCYIFG